MKITNPINGTAKQSRLVAPTFVPMGGVRPQADDTTVLGSHTWSPPIT